MKGMLRKVFLYCVIVAVVLAGGAAFFVGRSGAEPEVLAGNLLENPSFEELDQRGVPRGWSVVRENGAPTVTIGAVAGLRGKHALAIGVSQYEKGNVSVRSPEIPVRAGTAYQFSAYYRTAGLPFSLVAYLSYKGGVQERQVLGVYDDTNGRWSPFSAAVKGRDGLQTIAFAIHLSANGKIDIDSANVVIGNEPTLAPVCDASANLIDNGDLQTVVGAWPRGWEPFYYGDNKAANQLVNDNHDIYAVSTITEFRDGQAKWVFLSVETKGVDRYCFSLSYKSDVRTDVMARMVLADGTERYQYVGTLLPSGDWTSYSAIVRIPAEAVSLQIAPELIRVGSISTDDYVLSVAP